MHRPSWARHVRGSEWRNEQNKLIDPPSVNFAGKYFISSNSLGTGARYYALTDLATGRDLSVLDKFAATEDSPTLPNGMHYLFILTHKSNSRLLKVRYQQETWGAESGPCYERYFVLTGAKLVRVGSKRYPCTNE